jgi:hypothetical protein
LEDALKKIETEELKKSAGLFEQATVLGEESEEM